MKNTNNHPFAGYKLSQINLKSRQIIENKQEPKISTGLAVRTKLVAGEDAPFPFNLLSHLFDPKGPLVQLFEDQINTPTE